MIFQSEKLVGDRVFCSKGVKFLAISLNEIKINNTIKELQDI